MRMNKETLDSMHEYKIGDIFFFEPIFQTVKAIEEIDIGDTILLGVNCLPC